MRRLLRRCAIGFVLLILISDLSSQTLIIRAAKAVTHQQPIAYIGWDGNVWVTDLQSGVGTKITNNGNPNKGAEFGDGYPPPNSNSYKRIQWSPTDSALSVDAEDSGVYIFKSGLTPFQVQIPPITAFSR